MARSRMTPQAAPTRSGNGGWAQVGALVGALLAVVCFAPASWLARAAFAASDGRLVLRETLGTVWQGSAQLGLAGGPGSSDAMRLPGRVQWNMRPSLRGLHLALQADCCTRQAQELFFQPLWRAWRVQLMPGASTWPAAVLAGLGTPWNTVQLQGPLQLQTPGLTLRSNLDRIAVEGTLTLDLPDLASSLSTLRPLGSYRLQLHGGAQPTLDLRTLQGSLQLQGTGQWTAGQLRFVGEARATPAHEAALSNLLNIMGRRDGARSVITLG